MTLTKCPKTLILISWGLGSVVFCPQFFQSNFSPPSDWFVLWFSAGTHQRSCRQCSDAHVTKSTAVLQDVPTECGECFVTLSVVDKREDILTYLLSLAYLFILK